MSGELLVHLGKAVSPCLRRIKSIDLYCTGTGSVTAFFPNDIQQIALTCRGPTLHHFLRELAWPSYLPYLQEVPRLRSVVEDAKLPSALVEDAVAGLCNREHKVGNLTKNAQCLFGMLGVERKEGAADDYD